MLSVKGIFKTLIGTVLVIAISSLLIEYFNLLINSTQLKTLIELSINKACSYYEQETYKRSDVTTINARDIIGNDGSIAIAGNFYGTGTPEQVYDNLYTNSPSFKQWCYNFADNWYNVKLLYKGMTNSLSGTEEEKMFSKFYKEYKMTPLNLGITYLDKNVVEHIAKWNLLAILCNGNTQNIVLDDGEPYVLYNGYYIYYNTLKITELNYTVFDLSNSYDKKAFETLTNINSDNLSFGALGTGQAEDERYKICVADLKYSVKIKYNGVTPFQNVIRYVWDTEVDGYNGNAQTRKPLGTPKDTNELVGGGKGNTNSLLPIENKLIYYIVR